MPYFKCKSSTLAPKWSQFAEAISRLGFFLDIQLRFSYIRLPKKGVLIKRAEFIRKGGWDKMPGQEKADYGVARACSDGLELLIEK